MYELGNLELKNRIFLAPMLEPNDIAFRLLCKKAGCGLTWTGMTSPLSKQKLDLDDKPILQLFGNSSKGIEEFMKKYDDKVSGWDFNLGCPSKLSRRLKHGACLDDLGVIKDIVRTMRENTKKPLTVKIRKSDYAFDVLRITEEAKVDAICIHPRTLAQGYSGEVDYDFALELKKKSGIPVIFSGVSKLEDVEKILKDFDFVMIGRKAIGNPGVFGKKIGLDEYLELAKEYGLYFRQVKYQAMNFTKGLRGGKELRMRLIECKSVEEIEEIMS
ncbi:tRNA-dihydrouridine synthase family protein [Methanococcoides sp. SA1]|nr:tRNA-dihydrouridine synthase family protein [Methanococcoides sp. SA1]